MDNPPDLSQIRQKNFEKEALRQFNVQYNRVPVYRDFVNLIKVKAPDVQRLEDIPFLPIELFKTHKVAAGDAEHAEEIFVSSGTTGSTTSRHFVLHRSLYEASFRLGFERVYGPVQDYCVMALLPSYLERGDSSLVYMARSMIEESRHDESGFYLDDLKRLCAALENLEVKKQKTILLGVTFALLDLAERYTGRPLKYTTVIETGGMKGRKREMVRDEVHRRLTEAFGVSLIHSEYGMTELLSQAWSTGQGYECPTWMQVKLRDVNDPFGAAPEARPGGINVIDLANFYSCSFIATSDLGKFDAYGRFEVLGRFDASDVRGCNLLIET